MSNLHLSFLKIKGIYTALDTIAQSSKVFFSASPTIKKIIHFVWNTVFIKRKSESPKADGAAEKAEKIHIKIHEKAQHDWDVRAWEWKCFREDIEILFRIYCSVWVEILPFWPSPSALRPRLQCPSRPAAVTQPAQPPPASLPPTAPALASPGSHRPSLSPGPQWGNFNAHARPSIYSQPRTQSHLGSYNHEFICPLQVSPSKSQGFSEQRSQTIAVLSSPPRATTALRYWILTARPVLSDI